MGVPMNAAESLLNSEISWLKRLTTEPSEEPVDENLLEGHLCLCRELLAFVSPEKKFEVGASNKTGVNLIRDLVEMFVFPASKMHTVYKRTESVPMGEVSRRTLRHALAKEIQKYETAFWEENKVKRGT